jgi:glycerophosphoryl diester phosphodiesterase
MPRLKSDHDHSAFDILPHPAIIAHRGASAYAPENTIASFELAILQKADAIELDVWLTRDGHVVVIHGPDLDRTTGFHGSVSSITLDQIKKLDAGSHFDSAYKQERVPTLCEVFEAVGQKIIIDIELKNYTSFSSALPEKVAETVKKHNLQTRVFFSSFNPITIRQIQRWLPDTPTGLLALHGIKGLLSRSALAQVFHYQSLHPYYADVNPSLVSWLHEQEKRLYAYPVNEPEDMHRMVEFNVDGIITNNPLLARRIFKENSQSEIAPPGKTLAGELQTP